MKEVTDRTGDDDDDDDIDEVQLHIRNHAPSNLEYDTVSGVRI